MPMLKGFVYMYNIQSIKDCDIHIKIKYLDKRVSNDTLYLLQVGVECIIFRNMKFLLGVIIIIDFFL